MSGKNVQCQDCLFITNPKGNKTKFAGCQKGCGERGIRKVTVVRNCDEYIDRHSIVWE